MKMSSLTCGSLGVAFAILAVFLNGCDQGATGPTDPASDSNAKAESHDGHDHDHDGHEGHDHAAHDHTAPHGGHLVELGRNHEYHAELVDDHDAGSLTVYILDGDMKPLAIEQESITLVLTANDQTQTFTLNGADAEGTPAFRANDAELMKMLDAEGASGKLRVTVDGKPFSGTFSHGAHDGHEGHSHDH